MKRQFLFFFLVSIISGPLNIIASPKIDECPADRYKPCFMFSANVKIESHTPIIDNHISGFTRSRGTWNIDLQYQPETQCAKVLLLVDMGPIDVPRRYENTFRNGTGTIADSGSFMHKIDDLNSALKILSQFCQVPDAGEKEDVSQDEELQNIEEERERLALEEERERLAFEEEQEKLALENERLRLIKEQEHQAELARLQAERERLAELARQRAEQERQAELAQRRARQEREAQLVRQQTEEKTSSASSSIFAGVVGGLVGQTVDDYLGGDSGLGGSVGGLVGGLLGDDTSSAIGQSLGDIDSGSSFESTSSAGCSSSAQASIEASIRKAQAAKGYCNIARAVKPAFKKALVYYNRCPRHDPTGEMRKYSQEMIEWANQTEKASCEDY